MKWTIILLLVLVFAAGCRETETEISLPTLETAIISCEAAHVTIETPPSKLEEFGGND